MNDLRDTLILITTSFPIKEDGSEAAGSFVADFAQALAKHVRVNVVAPGSVSVREMWSEGVEVFRYASPQKPLSTLKPWNPVDLLSILRVLRSGRRATNEASQSGRAMHIIALWALPSGYWARCVGQKAGIPYSVWTLGSDIWTLGRIPLLRSYLRKVLVDAARCFSDGLQLAEDTRRISGREADFLPSTRHLQVSDARVSKAASPYTLIFLGRWHPNKGVDLLIEALGLLDEDDWQRIESVEIHGGGPLEREVRSGVEHLVAQGRPVIAGGYLDKTAAEAAISRADFMLIPSRIESIPVVFSDAMKLGAPVIAMPTGDLRALIEHAPACGIVADTIDAPAFARALSQVLRQSPAAFVEGTRDRARQFDLPTIAGQLLKQLRREA